MSGKAVVEHCVTPSTLVRPADHHIQRERHYAPASVPLMTTRTPEETEREAAFARGDDHGLRAAFDAHGGLIYNFCRRSVGADAAHDLTQEIFLSAWRAHHTFDPSRGSLPGWLMGIAKNRLIDRLRADQRQVPRTEMGYNDPADTDRLLSVEQVATKMLVADALTMLPERQRQVMELAFFEDLSQSQIAERTELPLGTVKSDMRRGLARMRRHLEVSSD